MTSTLKRVVVAGGGTGGHVFPALAFAKALQEKGVDVCWLGTANGLEANIAPLHHVPLHLIHVLPWRGKNIFQRLRAPIALLQAFWQARRFLRAFKPDVLVGFGGFVSAPGGIAAWSMGIPLVIHEQNAVAGLTNRWLNRLSVRTLQAFSSAFSNVNPSSVKTVGNPLRPDFFLLETPEDRFRERNKNQFRMLVLGGSLGAMKLNRVVPKALAHLNDSSIFVVHQTGERHLEDTQKQYEEAGIPAHQYELKPFIQDMPNAYASSDFVICRAGALTVSEVCASGVPALFIPYPHAADDHQRKNAEYLVNQHAGIMLLENVCTPETLSLCITAMMNDSKKREAMAVSAYRLRQTEVLSNMIQICEEILP